MQPSILALELAGPICLGIVFTLFGGMLFLNLRTDGNFGQMSNALRLIPLVIMFLFSAPEISYSASNSAADLLSALDRCTKSLATGRVVEAFDGWKTIRRFERTCQSCSSLSGSFKAPGSDLTIDVVVKDPPTTEFGTNFGCRVSRATKQLPSSVDFAPQYKKWIDSKIAEKVVPDYSGQFNVNGAFRVCLPEHSKAWFHLFSTPIGVAFEMIWSGQSKNRPTGC